MTGIGHEGKGNGRALNLILANQPKRPVRGSPTDAKDRLIQDVQFTFYEPLRQITAHLANISI